MYPQLIDVLGPVRSDPTSHTINATAATTTEAMSSHDNTAQATAAGDAATGATGATGTASESAGGRGGGEAAAGTAWAAGAGAVSAVPTDLKFEEFPFIETFQQDGVDMAAKILTFYWYSFGTASYLMHHFRV